MMFLRQSTASQEVLLGPFLDDTDGKTAETALTIANTDIKVWKWGGTSESSKNSGGATHIASGRYYAVLDATDTDTVGGLILNVHVSGALPVRLECWVLEEAVFDAMFAASAAGYSTYAGGDTSGTTTLLARLTSTRAGYLDNLDATISSRSTLTQTQVTGGAYAINSSSFAFHSSMDFTTTQKAATIANVTNVASATLANGAHGGASATLELDNLNIGSLSAETLTITGAVTVAYVGNDIRGVDVNAIQQSTTAATNLKNTMLAVYSAAVQTDAGNTETTFATNLPAEADDYYGDSSHGLVIAFISTANNKYQTRKVVASTTSGGNTVITVDSPFDAVPTVGDTFVSLGRG
jgi:hypothetical protein